MLSKTLWRGRLSGGRLSSATSSYAVPMSFHLEHLLDGRHHRTGTFNSHGEALLAALRIRQTPVLIVEDADNVSPGSGDVITVVLQRGELIPSRDEPSWWAGVGRTTQRALLNGDTLSADVVTDVTRAGGTVVASAWESGPIGDWELTPTSDGEWIRFEAARRQVRG